MNRILKWRAFAPTVIVFMCAAFGPFAATVGAQGRQGPPGRRQGPPAGPMAQPGVSPAEIQQLFDAYVVMQAQQALKLTDEQYPQFLIRVRALQTVRRRAENERVRILQELRRLTQAADGEIDDGQIKERLKMLDELEARSAPELKQALDGLDQVLDVRQRARFRIFEQQMERRKVELLMRARPANRPRNQF